MTNHSVENHLRVSVSDYDTAIRKFVPHYASGLQSTVNILKKFIPSKAKILDLGGGTGALSEAILNGISGVHVTLLDIDPEMIKQAKLRLESQKSRLDFHQGSFFETLPQCDAVVASLSLHHIHELNDKKKIYHSIRKSLKPGGVFLNLDATVSADGTISKMAFDMWAEHMGQNGISQDQARGHFEAWKKEDCYFSLYEELNALASAGFKNPECFWRQTPLAIYGGLGDERS